MIEKYSVSLEMDLPNIMMIKKMHWKNLTYDG